MKSIGKTSLFIVMASLALPSFARAEELKPIDANSLPALKCAKGHCVELKLRHKDGSKGKEVRSEKDSALAYLGTTGLLGRSLKTRVIYPNRKLKLTELIFQARDDDFYADNIEVNFRNGDSYYFDPFILEEDDSFSMDLAAEGERIHSIVIRGSQANLFGTKAQMEVWGVQAVPLKSYLLGDTGLLGRSAKTRTINVDPDLDIRQLWFTARDDDFYVGWVEITYDDGYREVLMRKTLIEEDSSIYFNFEPGTSIRRIQIRGSQGQTFGTKASLEVIGSVPR